MTGLAIYDPHNNRLEITRKGESMKRYIPCTNIRPPHDKVHGIQVDGDDIWVWSDPAPTPDRTANSYTGSRPLVITE